jgi:hypothetical protein
MSVFLIKEHSTENGHIQIMAAYRRLCGRSFVFDFSAPPLHGIIHL